MYILCTFPCPKSMGYIKYADLKYIFINVKFSQRKNSRVIKEMILVRICIIIVLIKNIEK